MTVPALPLSDLTLAAVQGAATKIRLQEQARADAIAPTQVVHNLITAVEAVTGCLADDGQGLRSGVEHDQVERSLIDVAAWACLAVEAGVRSRTRPRLSGGSGGTSGY
jgi:hypothetical protein